MSSPVRPPAGWIEQSCETTAREQLAGPVGVALLGHGSARSHCTAEGLRAVATRLAARLGDTAEVQVAFFEFLHPTLEETLESFRARGFTKAIVLPYFLFEGKEIKIEIPDLLRQLTPRFPGLQLILGPDLGVDRRLIDLLAQRVAEALAGLGQLLPIGGRLPVRGEPGRLGVIVVNRGSRARYDDGSRLREICRLLRQRLGGVPVEPAQAERSVELTIQNAASRLVAAGGERIVVLPYLHFPGKVLTVNVIPAVNQAAARHPGVRFYLASTLCVDDRLIEVCVDRLQQCLERRPEAPTIAAAPDQ